MKISKKAKDLLQAAAILIFGIFLVAADLKGWEVWSSGSIIHQPIPSPVLAILGIIFMSVGIVALIRISRGKEP